MIQVAPNIWQIDTLLGNFSGMTAVYLINGHHPVLVETGAANSSNVVVDELRSFGIGANDLASIVVTHIHVDHAGGIGQISEAFPSAEIRVHEKGLRHLVDPSRLMDSAERVFGPLLDSLFGRMLPVQQERISPMASNDVLDIGDGRILRALETPGHAKHHLSFFEQDNAMLFCGDSLGVLLQSMSTPRPSAPPPDFDLGLAEGSMDAMSSLDPRLIAFPHFGVFESSNIINDAKKELARWVDVAHFAMQAGDDVHDVLKREFPYPVDVLPQGYTEMLEKLNSFRANADGITRYLASAN